LITGSNVKAFLIGCEAVSGSTSFNPCAPCSGLSGFAGVVVCAIGFSFFLQVYFSSA
jgi:hypothetical protein